MTVVRLLLVSSLALACGPKTPPAEVVPEFEAPVSPIVPSPDGARYVTGAGTPRDPLVAKVIGEDLPWDESLAGAAAGLALDDAVLPSLEGAAWAAVRAGYPYPVVTVLTGEVPPGEFPVGLGDGVRSNLRPGDDLGLVRARTNRVDRWVAVIGRPLMDLGAFEREGPVGREVDLGSGLGAHWSLVSPTGNQTDGVLPATLRLDEEGEYWLVVRREADDALVVSIPLYAGMRVPGEPVLVLPGAPANAPGEAVAQGYALLDGVREAFDLVAIQHDPTLETLAQRPLERVADGSWSRADGEARLRAAGFVGGPAVQLSCAAKTVAACLDRLMTDVDGRVALLDPQLRVGGIAAQVETGGLRLVLNLASE